MNVVEPVEPVDEVGCCPRQPCCEVKSRSDFGCSGERMSKTQLLQQLDREKHEHLKIQQLEQDNLRLKQEMKGILQEMERMKVRLCKLEQSNEKPSSPVLSHTLQPQDTRRKSKYKDMEHVQGMGSEDKIGLKGFNPFDDKKLGLRSHSEPVPLVTSTVVSIKEIDKWRIELEQSNKELRVQLRKSEEEKAILKKTCDDLTLTNDMLQGTIDA